MPGSAEVGGELNDADFGLIDVVVKHVLEFGVIPSTIAMAQLLSCTRQGVLRKMEGAARRGVLQPRPRYATNWFELTPLGERLYRQRIEHANRESL